MNLQQLKQKVYELIEVGGSTTSKRFDQVIAALIIISTMSIIVESLQTLPQPVTTTLYFIEIITIIAFSIEYALRLWTANLKMPGNALTSRLRWMKSPLAIIDLLAILPFFAPILTQADLRFIRLLRLVRMLRLLKLARYNTGLHLIGEVIYEKKEELTVTLFITTLLLLIASTLMFYVENPAQPEVFTNVFMSFWWAIATLTTVGYGDIYPITGAGRLLSGIIAIIGIGLVALPTSILSGGFIEKMRKPKRCPHCDKPL